MANHKSDSSDQMLAEAEMLRVLAVDFGLDLVARPDRVAELKSLKPDGIDWSKRVLVEAYAHVGDLKGAQLHKVKADILKLLFLERMLMGDWKKVLCFGDPIAARSVIEGSKSWLAAAVREFGIVVHVAKHSDEMCQRLRIAQQRQKMVNA